MFSMVVSGSGSGVTALTGEFSDYQEFGMDFGYRHFLTPMGGFEPWVAARIGFKAIDNIELDLQPAPAALAAALGGGLTPASFDDIGFFDSTLTYNVGLDVGFQYRLRHNISLGFETGLYYSGDLDSDEDPFSFDGLFGGGTGSVAGANDDGSRPSLIFYTPILFTLH